MRTVCCAIRVPQVPLIMALALRGSSRWALVLYAFHILVSSAIINAQGVQRQSLVCIMLEG